MGTDSEDVKQTKSDSEARVFLITTAIGFIVLSAIMVLIFKYGLA